MAVGSPDLKAFLIATPFFGGLSDASLDLLVSMLVERRFDVGATVVAEARPSCRVVSVTCGSELRIARH
jgi:CRP/FNR family cyclic AMP-dependent transcriptional regulator